MFALHVGQAVTARPDELLIVDYADGDARQAAVGHLSAEPGLEQARRALHLRIVGEGGGDAGVMGQETCGEESDCAE